MDLMAWVNGMSTRCPRSRTLLPTTPPI